MQHFERTIQQLQCAWRRGKGTTAIQTVSKPCLTLLEKQDPAHPLVRAAADPLSVIRQSPKRHCGFTRKKYPNYMMMRFELAQDPESGKVWASPTVDHLRHGGREFGYYTLLDASVLEKVQKKHGGVFRGRAQYPAGMTTFVREQMMDSIVQHAQQGLHPPLFIPLDAHASSESYQCLLTMHPEAFIPTALRGLPCYPLHQHAWEPLKDHLLDERHYRNDVVLGVPKAISSVDFAIRLWRFQRLLGGNG
ncbi:hypothetical protein BC940DRAFT_312550 [Gongronella butleri]|nr:hypothetical protein BC940DRAFT_312550 [Gongronella butleri]